MIDQSQFNLRACPLRPLVEKLRQYWIYQKGRNRQTCYLLDIKPVPVLSYKHDKRHSDFLSNAGYGVCASRKLKYFGFKLVSVTTLRGIPVVYDLVPANLDERLAAEAIIDHISGSDLFSDKGFLGSEDCRKRLLNSTYRVLRTGSGSGTHKPLFVGSTPTFCTNLDKRDKPSRIYLAKAGFYI